MNVNFSKTVIVCEVTMSDPPPTHPTEHITCLSPNIQVLFHKGMWLSVTHHPAFSTSRMYAVFKQRLIKGDNGLTTYSAPYMFMINVFTFSKYHSKICLQFRLCYGKTTFWIWGFKFPLFMTPHFTKLHLFCSWSLKCLSLHFNKNEKIDFVPVNLWYEYADG